MRALSRAPSQDPRTVFKETGFGAPARDPSDYRVSVRVKILG